MFADILTLIVEKTSLKRYLALANPFDFGLS